MLNRPWRKFQLLRADLVSGRAAAKAGTRLLVRFFLGGERIVSSPLPVTFLPMAALRGSLHAEPGLGSKSSRSLTRFLFSVVVVGAERPFTVILVLRLSFMVDTLRRVAGVTATVVEELELEAAVDLPQTPRK